MEKSYSEQRAEALDQKMQLRALGDQMGIPRELLDSSDATRLRADSSEFHKLSAEIRAWCNPVMTGMATNILERLINDVILEIESDQSCSRGFDRGCM